MTTVQIEIPETPPMTAHEVFDYVIRHLKKQGKQAWVERTEEKPGMCAYRSPDGCSCAVGCLIPDALYDPAMEGHNIFHDLIDRALGKLGLSSHVSLLMALQRLHDTDEHWLPRGGLSRTGNARLRVIRQHYVTEGRTTPILPDLL